MTLIKTTKSILVFALIMFSSAAIYAQHKSGLLLSGHTFSKGQNEIGSIHIASGPVPNQNISLKGKDAKAFTISGNNQLKLRSSFNKGDVKWYDLIIEVNTNQGLIANEFRIVNDQFIGNKVIAHRGAWKNTNTPQNSLAALKHAIDMGCEGSEFDVRMSADSVLFINHDPEFQGVVIEETTAKELAKLKLSNGESLPTLKEYIEAGIKQNKTKLILEIKPTVSGREHMLAITRKAVQVVDDLKAHAWIDYISFDYDACQELIRLNPHHRVAYLKGDKSPEVLAADNIWGLDYNSAVIKKNENWIDDAHQRNLTVNVWTVNDAETIQWLLDKNVEFITTDEPEKALQLAKQ